MALVMHESMQERRRVESRPLRFGLAFVLIGYVIFAGTGHVLPERFSHSLLDRVIGNMYLSAFRPIGLLIPLSIVAFVPLSPKGRLFAAGLVTALGIALAQYFASVFLVSMAAWLGLIGAVLIIVAGVKAWSELVQKGGQ